MKKFWLKLLIFMTPLIILMIMDLYIFPKEYFTFRAWEIVSYNGFDGFKMGPFYPNMNVDKIEEGDLGHDTKYAVTKEVHWATDQYGYRNYEGKGHDIVVIGDSSIAGATLDQDDIFTEVLEDMIDDEVYSMGYADINDYISDIRFSDDPPQRVIISSAEVTLSKLPAIENQQSFEKKTEDFFKRKNVAQEIIRELDRFFKLRIIRYVNSAIERNINIFFDEGSVDDIAMVSDGVLFFKIDPDYDRRTEADLEKFVRIIQSYQQYFDERDIDFIFMPIPSKRNVYYHALSTDNELNFLGRLIELLKAEGVQTVDMQEAFYQAQANGEQLYNIDDTHWNRPAVNIAAQLTAELISNSQK